MTQRHLRDSIPRTFDAFFDRFPRLLAIQRQAIPPLLEGRDVLLGAPTAGGKTEAVLAPILQRALAEAGRAVEAPCLLFVTPTRALVNDVFRRLQVPIERLGLTIGRKTADHPRPGRDLPQVLVTTPESLDSMLARLPKRLLPVRAIVLDELHALDGTPRGDQLAALVVRLRRVRAARHADLQVAMLSATVERPEAMAARYGRDPVVVRDPRRRPMRARLARCFSPELVPPCLAALVGGDGRQRRGKILVFANARADVETLARVTRGVPPFGDRVFAHHGSLAKQVRERVEHDFQHARTAVCIATSTLELGIDIGDVDEAVLYGVPPDIPSFLQRVGRAGRRADRVAVLALARDQGEVLRLRHMFARAREGRLLTDPPVYDPGTALQQAASLCLQNPGRAVAPEHVLDRLPDWQQAWWSEERLDRALLHAGRWFERVARGHYRPSEVLEKAFEVGTMHGNIGGEAEVEVLDELTGRRLGTIAASGGEESVLLAGAARRVRRQSDGRLVASAAASGEARFERKPMRAVPGALAGDLLEWLGRDPRVLWRVESEDETFFLHGLGTVSGLVLHASAGDLAVAAPGRGVAFGLRLRRGHADWPAHIAQRERLALFARGITGRLARQLGFGPWFRDLPEAERERAALAAVDPSGLAERLANAAVRELHQDEARRQARWLVAP